MVNRDRHSIVVDILEKSKTGKKKTELMRDAKLSYLQTKQYLGNLTKKGLLEIDEKSRFKTTAKGLEFLEKCANCLLVSWDTQEESKKKGKFK